MSSNTRDSPWRSTPAALRKAKPINLTLPEPIKEKLRRLAGRGGSISQVVARLVEAAPEPGEGKSSEG